MVTVIRHDDDCDWEVWLEPEHGDEFVGLCAGTGSTRARAIESALCELVVLVEKLRLDATTVRFTGQDSTP